MEIHVNTNRYTTTDDTKLKTKINTLRAKNTSIEEFSVIRHFIECTISCSILIFSFLSFLYHIYMQFIPCYVIIIEYFNTFLSSYSKTRSIIHTTSWIFNNPYFIIVKKIKFQRAFHNHKSGIFSKCVWTAKRLHFSRNKWQSFILAKWPETE